MKELWSQITDRPDYEVSTLGNVRRVVRRCGKIETTPQGRPLYTPVRVAPGGYFHAEGQRLFIHRIMAQVFLNDGEPLRRGQWVRSIDGNLRNRALSNLEITTPHIPRPPQTTNAVALVETWCKSNQIDDPKLRAYLYQKTGVMYQPKTVRVYRNRAGFVKRHWRITT